MTSILEMINKPNDIKQVDPQEYDRLAQEIREFLIQSISKTGGHLASNLGVVELTMALHLCLDLPKDKIIWDVGHQSYIHKLLTGRKDAFEGLRSLGGISGFPKQRESECDAFDTGHSSTSISAALGYVRARELTGADYKVVAVIGDGSLTGGMAYEALNNAGRLKSNMIIILNDNKMSISENVGGMSKYLNNLRINDNYKDFKEDVESVLNKIPGIGASMIRGMKRSKDSIRQLLIPGGFFEDLGVDYIGPIDGHDMTQMVRAVNAAKRHDKAVLIHVITQKGKGYMPAEDDPPAFHGVGCFDVETGEPVDHGEKSSYTRVFAQCMHTIAKENDRVVAVCAAMPYGTGLYKFSKRFPNKFFDVGIAEEHAVTFAAGLAAGGLKPYVAVYSTFLQRSYDQIVHDVCLQDLPVVFCIDRAGIVGADGETHHGVLDLSYLSSIPNMTVFAPKNKYELFDAVKFSVHFEHPLAIRYPKGEAYGGLKEKRAPIVHGKSELLYKGEKAAILAVGSMVKTAVKVREILLGHGVFVTVVNARFVKPMDTECILELAAGHSLLVTMEENVFSGSFGQQVNSFLMKERVKTEVYNVSVPDGYVEHGSVSALHEMLKLDEKHISEEILKRLQ